MRNAALEPERLGAASHELYNMHVAQVAAAQDEDTQAIDPDKILHFIECLSDRITQLRSKRLFGLVGGEYKEIGDLSSYAAPDIVKEALREAGIDEELASLVFPYKTKMHLLDNGHVYVDDQIITERPRLGRPLVWLIGNLPTERGMALKEKWFGKEPEAIPPVRVLKYEDLDLSNTTPVVGAFEFEHLIPVNQGDSIKTVSNFFRQSISAST